jgi:hypothetical protein
MHNVTYPRTILSTSFHAQCGISPYHTQYVIPCTMCHIPVPYSVRHSMHNVSYPRTILSTSHATVHFLSPPSQNLKRIFAGPPRRYFTFWKNMTVTDVTHFIRYDSGTIRPYMHACPPWRHYRLQKITWYGFWAVSSGTLFTSGFVKIGQTVRNL